MKLLNIDYIPGGQEFEALGIVKGTVVQSKNLGKDFMAGMKTLVGGEIAGYTEMLVEARQIATKRMVDEAEALGADAVINIRYGSSSVMQGAAEVVAYGTAVKLLCIPIIVNIGYEVQKACARHNNLLCRIVTAPGLWMQRITVKEPDDNMIKAAIAAMQAVIPENGEDLVK